MNRERRNRCWGCLSTFGKVARAYEAPFHVLRSLTIPAADEEQWNKMFAMIQPFTAVYFLLYVTGHLFATYKGFWIGLYLLPVQIILSLAVWKFTSSDQFPRCEIVSLTWDWIFILLSFSQLLLFVFRLFGFIRLLLWLLNSSSLLDLSLNCTPLSWAWVC